MARNGSGVYSLPAGSTVANGDTSDASDLNSPLADLEADQNTPRPIVAGGTGASSASAALVNLGLTATAAEINVLDGITATTAELNILDGVTATAAEINYVDGVTSPIQTQLDSKLSSIADGSITFAKLAAAAVVTESEGIASNDNDTSIPTSAAVKDYVDSAAGYTESSVVATTSGTSQTIGSIPAGTNRIELSLYKVSISANDVILIRLGTSGGLATTNYESSVSAAGVITNYTSSNAFIVGAGAAFRFLSGTILFVRHGSTDVWTASIGLTGVDTSIAGGGQVDLGAEITQLGIVAASGSLDAGSIHARFYP